MRFLHTSDWHLGRSFFGVSLLEDQAHVLDQLVRLATESSVDAVLLAGDVYDRSTPPLDAVSLLDETVTRLVVEAGIPVVVIAGNHDSGERLGFGSRLLGARGLHVAGTRPVVASFDDAHGRLDVVAVSFCEPAAVAARLGAADVADHDSALRAEFAALVTAAPARRRSAASARRRVAVAHAFVSGGSTSESERPLVMGNAALVAADCFEDFCYAALGHLHRPQQVGRAEVRYSGSLLKYSFDEASHRKSVSIVEIDGAGACRLEQVSLSPRRDVRIVEGSLEELRTLAGSDPGRDDYVLARLTGRGAVLDAMGKMRALYPNCLHIKRDEALAALAEEVERRADLRSHGEAELFDAFFREVTGQAADEAETRAFADALAAVRRREEDGGPSAGGGRS